MTTFLRLTVKPSLKTDTAMQKRFHAGIRSEKERGTGMLEEKACNSPEPETHQAAPMAWPRCGRVLEKLQFSLRRVLRKSMLFKMNAGTNIRSPFFGKVIHTSISIFALIGITGCNNCGETVWRYETFEYHDRIVYPYRTNKVWVPVVYWISDDLLSRRTNYCSSLNEVLDIAGSGGWEFAGFDGTNYILKTSRKRGNSISISMAEVDRDAL
jgi:hypothetical protein